MEAAATWFGHVDKVNGRTIDMKGSFCLEAASRTLLLKFLCAGLVAVGYIYLWVAYPYPYWFMAYLSYWTLLYAVVYLGSSLILSLVRVPLHSEASLPSSPSGRRLGFLLKFTWAMYLVAAVHGFMVVILFWATEYSPSKAFRYSTIAPHGISFAMVVLDGIWINKVPVRLCHVVFPFAMGCLFVGWSLIQGLVPIDNPNKEGPDESLYSILNWEEKPVASAIVSIIVLFGTFPFFTFFFWGLSLWNRRYVGEGSGNATTKDENMASEDGKLVLSSLEEEIADVEGLEMPQVSNSSNTQELEQP